MRTPNLNSLRMFDAAARHLNFRLASEELNLTQGAVAQQVRRLEAELGFPLFHRKARGLALTQIGSRYHGPIRRAIAMIDSATQNLKPENTIVTLSVPPSFASKWLVPRLGRLNCEHPAIDVQTVASEDLSDFHSDGVDIAIRQGHAPLGKDLRVEVLAPLDLCAVCSRKFAEKIAPVAQVESFRSHPLIQDSHHHWETLFEAAGLEPPKRMIQFNQTALAMDAAANGQGIALAPRLLLGDEIVRNNLEVLWRDARSDSAGFYIICPDQPRPNAARDIVFDWVLSEVRRSDEARELDGGSA